MTVLKKVLSTIKTKTWWTVTVIVMVMMITNVTSLSGPNVCMVKQKYNITKRVKYRAPMSVRTYEWCFAMPPRCSKWHTEMRDVTRLETEERTAEMAACCPGYKLRDVSCVPHCPSGKTGQNCLEDCPPNKWGPSCMHECKPCEHGRCDALTGVCRCQDGWQGESCETSMTSTAAAALLEQSLTTESTATKTSLQEIPTSSSTITTYPVAITPKISNNTAFVSNLTLQTTRTWPSVEITPKMITTLPTTIGTSLTTRNDEELTTILSITNRSIISSNKSIAAIPVSTINTHILDTEEPKIQTINATVSYSNYNRTDIPLETDKYMTPVKVMETNETKLVKNNEERTTISPARTTTAISTIPIHQIHIKTSTASTTTTTIKSSTRKISTTNKQTVTTKPKAKEIWIKPAQKGESPISEAKIKTNQEHTKPKYKDIIEITTPKTIIVSIIPTSVTYVTFKKIALTTSSLIAQKNNTTSNSNNRTTETRSTKPMIVQTTSLPTTANVLEKTINMWQSTNISVMYQNVTKTNSSTPTTTRTFQTIMSTTQPTNSMLSTLNVSNKRLNSSLLTSVPSFPTNVTKSRRKQHPLFESTTSRTITTALFNHKFPRVTATMTEQFTVPEVTVINVQKNITKHATEMPNVAKMFTQTQANSITRNITNHKSTSIADTVTDDPTNDEETLHILTEPEHITAVMGDKGNDKSTINLISVISIAGGVMMAVITVAIIIVMLERCKKPRYDDVRKYNDIRMQVMIDNNDDIPPPYVRSIFHTPLPEPPTSEKCHYQPISTLDRNLKQFMRPVVVQTISPLMLENFRGILECHYDHLPRRSQDMGTMQTHCSVAPSIDEREELLPPPRMHSLTDSDIEAMKCEAKLDVIDNTTSEPLYAEIPCWRPPSAHAIEVVNLNGEAVTEL